MSQESRKLAVASSPHVSSPIGTRSLMLDVLIALVPALCIGIWFFGPRALTMTVVSVLACEIFEYGKLLKKTNTCGDLSAAITGVLLAFVCPVTLPYWVLIIGDFFAIVVVKQLFGGLGKNFLNPALAGRAFLTAAYAGYMTVWAVPSVLSGAVDAATMATPLSYLYSGQPLPEYMGLGSIFLGGIPGSVGEISTLAVLIGGLWLLARKVISWRIPVSFIGSVAVLCLIFGHEGYGRFDWMLLNVCSGGLVLGAFFMATDYSTSPVTLKGQLVFGLGCGVLTVLIRYFGSYPEGVSYAILIMNCCTWGVDKLTRPRQFGVSAEDVKAAKAAKKAAKKQAKEGAANG